MLHSPEQREKLQETYTEFLHRWNQRTKSMCSVFSEDVRPVRGQTVCFKKKLEEGILAEQETLREMIEIVETPETEVSEETEKQFRALLQNNDAVEWEKTLLEIPQYVDEYINYKLIMQYAFNESNSVTFHNNLEINQLL